MSLDGSQIVLHVQIAFSLQFVQLRVTLVVIFQWHRRLYDFLAFEFSKDAFLVLALIAKVFPVVALGPSQRIIVYNVFVAVFDE